MAFLAQDDKQQQDPNQQAQGSANVGSSSPLANQGGSGVGSGAPTSTAGMGAGGQGWTNIQAYLNANQGNTTSADALNEQVGSSFDQDKQGLDQSASSTKSQAQAQSARNDVSTDQASKYITAAGKDWTYGTPTQSDAYRGDIQPLKDAYSAQYQGPNSYNYTMSPDTQNYGQALNPQNNQAFQGLMGSIYNQAAGGQMGSGQFALQSQIDSDNGALANARSDLNNRYNGLMNYAYGADGKSGLAGDTNSAIQQAQTDMQTHHTNLDQYLKGAAATDQGNIDSAVKSFQDADTALQNAGPGSQAYLPFIGGKTLDLSKAYDWNPGAVDETSVTGVDPYRNNFNAIQDLLGGVGINRGADAQHGTYTLNKQKLASL